MADIEIKTAVKKNTDALIEWEAPEYNHSVKSNEWYWIMAAVALIFIIIGVWMQNFLFIIIIFLSVFSIALFSARHPNLIHFALTSRGLKIDKRIFPYEDLESFWMHYNPPHQKEVGIISKKLFMPRIVVPTGDTDPNKIREQLVKFVAEEPHTESIAESISRFIGF